MCAFQGLPHQVGWLSLVLTQASQGAVVVIDGDRFAADLLTLYAVIPSSLACGLIPALRAEQKNIQSDG